MKWNFEYEYYAIYNDNLNLWFRYRVIIVWNSMLYVSEQL